MQSYLEYNLRRTVTEQHNSSFDLKLKPASKSIFISGTILMLMRERG